jgi:hypothetical protein
MSRSERIEFNFSFEYDSTMKSEFESIWNIGLQMLTLADNYAAQSEAVVDIKVNESPGALEDRLSASA